MLHSCKRCILKTRICCTSEKGVQENVLDECATKIQTEKKILSMNGASHPTSLPVTAISTPTLAPHSSAPLGTGHKQRCLGLTEHLEHPLALWLQSSAVRASWQFAPLNHPFHPNLSRTGNRITHPTHQRRGHRVILFYCRTHLLCIKMFKSGFSGSWLLVWYLF